RFGAGGGGGLVEFLLSLFLLGRGLVGGELGRRLARGDRLGDEIQRGGDVSLLLLVDRAEPENFLARGRGELLREALLLLRGGVLGRLGAEVVHLLPVGDR